MLEKNVLILMGSHRPYLLIGILTKGRKTSAKTYSNSELEGPMGGSLLAEALPPRLVKIPVGPRGTSYGMSIPTTNHRQLDLLLQSQLRIILLNTK
jgi:hypothetical protein